MKKVVLIIICLLIIIIPVTAEKWVGKVATYQLLDGSKIANGDLFDRESLSAACNGFRLGSDVTVTNVKTGEQITVTVNDRVRQDSNYFMLLTPKAARELGIEWETSLVVIKASFSDVNSVERLPVKGLVPEGTIDTERIREFPEVNWPDETDIITNRIETDDRDYPQKDTFEKEPLKRKENEFMDYDQQDSATFYDSTPEIDEIPREEKTRKPLRERKGSLLDDDEGDFTKYYQEELEEYPREEYIRSPLKRDRYSRMDNDSGKTRQEKIEDPMFEKERFPERRKEIVRMDGDVEDGEYPIEERSKRPLEMDTIMDTDEDNGIFPLSDDRSTPVKRIWMMDDDGLDEPRVYEWQQPDLRQNRMSEDSQETPYIENLDDPDFRRAQMDTDEDISFQPDLETRKNPEKDNNLIDNDIEDIETDETPLVWAKSLTGRKPYIRVSTTFSPEEGNRRYRLFKKVFSGVVGVKREGRYILFIGPVEDKDIDRVLSKIREYGFKDAYVTLP
jgi:hypothetical protein